MHYLLSPDFKPTFEVFGLSNICLSYKPVSNICTLLHYATCVVYARWPPLYNVITDRLCSLRLALNCIYRQMFKYFFASHVKGILRCIGNYYMYYLFICQCHVIYISLSQMYRVSHKKVHTYRFRNVIPCLFISAKRPIISVIIYFHKKTSVHLFSRRAGTGSTELGLFPGLSFLRLELS